MIFKYKGKKYPSFIKDGNASGHIAKIAGHFCKGEGLDIGSGGFPFQDAIGIDAGEQHAMNLPNKKYDYIFSSHCLEHLENYVEALRYWKTRLKPNGVLFLYLPHRKMEYWRPQNNPKHLHEFRPKQIKKLLQELGFVDVLNTQRDFYYSFAVVGFNKEVIDEEQPETD